MRIKKNKLINSISKIIIGSLLLSCLVLLGCSQMLNMLNPQQSTNNQNQALKLVTAGDIINNNPAAPENYILSLTYGLYGDESSGALSSSLFLDNAASGSGSRICWGKNNYIILVNSFSKVFLLAKT